jgi:hypothetical protein
MNVIKQALTMTEIETLAPATSAEFNERQPLFQASGAGLSRPKTRQGMTLRWFIDGLAFAGGAMAGVHVGVWLDPPNFDPNSEDTEAKERSRDSFFTAADCPCATADPDLT